MKKVNRFLPFRELPQNIAGYVMSRIWKKRLKTLSEKEIQKLYDIEEKRKRVIIVAEYDSKKKDPVLRYLSGASIGKYILLHDLHSQITLDHEEGHGDDSYRLGWLYLLTVGIYSALLCNMWDRVFHKKWTDYDRVYWYYMTRWTEKRADKNGKVDRDAYLRNIERDPASRYPEV